MRSIRIEWSVASDALARIGTPISIPRNGTIYRQSDHADCIYYVERGLVRVDLAASDGRHALVALLGPGSFLGVSCLDARERRRSEASAVLSTRALSIPRESLLRLLRSDPSFAGEFTSYLVQRIARAQEDMADLQLNSIEKRLARALLLLAHMAGENGQQTALTSINQQTLAEIVGTTRPRVSHFLGKFRREGYVSGRTQLRVNSTLAKVLLRS
jgi:CRP/FNR family cyclic AMP-dependent transcriptional regulator